MNSAHFTLIYNQIEAGDPRNPRPFAICGAKRANRDGEVCKQPAGWGTAHLGEGRCRRHGGSSLRGPEKPDYKHGFTAYGFRGSLAEAYEREAAQVTPHLTDLTRELQAARVLAMIAVDKLQGGDGTLSDVPGLEHEHELVVDAMMTGGRVKKVVGGGVVVEVDGKVSSSLALSRSVPPPEKLTTIMLALQESQDQRENNEMTATRIWRALYPEMKPPEWEEMQWVVRHIEGVAKIAMAMENIRANDQMTRMESSYAIQQMRLAIRAMGLGEEKELEFAKYIQKMIPGSIAEEDVMVKQEKWQKSGKEAKAEVERRREQNRERQRRWQAKKRAEREAIKNER